MNGGWSFSYEIALRWMPLDLTDEKSTLVQVMAWCRQATSHYLSQCWPKSLSPYGVTRPQWVSIITDDLCTVITIVWLLFKFPDTDIRYIQYFVMWFEQLFSYSFCVFKVIFHSVFFLAIIWNSSVPLSHIVQHNKHISEYLISGFSKVLILKPTFVCM